MVCTLYGIPLPVSGPALATFLTRHPNLGQVIFQFYILDDHHCRALATVKERAQLRVELFSVKFTAAGKEAFAETLQLNQGPNLDLDELIMSAGDLARALRGNRNGAYSNFSGGCI